MGAALRALSACMYVSLCECMRELSRCSAAAKLSRALNLSPAVCVRVFVCGPSAIVGAPGLKLFECVSELRTVSE